MKKKINAYLFLFLSSIFCSTTFIYAQNQYYFLQIQSNNENENKLIDSLGYVKKHISLKEMQSEIRILQNKFIKKGYFDIQAKAPKKRNDSTYISFIKLNKLYDTLYIKYDQNIEFNLAPYLSQTSDSIIKIPIEKVEPFLQQITNDLVNKGNTFSKIGLSAIKKTKEKLTAELILSKSPKRIIDSIKIKGYEKFPKSFLKYNIRIKKGQVFSKSEILQKALEIDQLRFVKNIKPPEVLFKDQSTEIYLYLNKEYANSFDGYLGLSNNEESDDLEINGLVDLQLINNLNYGEELLIYYKNDGNEQQRFEASLTLPFLFKTPLGIKAKLSIFRQDSTFLNTGQDVNINYTINSKNSIFIAYENLSSRNLLENTNDNNLITDFTSNFYGSGYQFTSRRNNFIAPIKSFLNLGISYGVRNFSNQRLNQGKGRLNLSHIFDLNPKNSIYIRNESGILLSENYLINELFRFGGIQSIRGFEENSLFASIYNVLNTEYRYLLSPSLQIHSIIDYAYFEDQSREISDNLTSFGFGLGILTRSGLFRLIFANGKSSNQSFRFANTKVHFSLEARF